MSKNSRMPDEKNEQPEWFQKVLAELRAEKRRRDALPPVWIDDDNDREPEYADPDNWFWGTYGDRFGE